MSALYTNRSSHDDELTSEQLADAHVRAVELTSPKPRHEIEAEKAAKPRPDLLPPRALAVVASSTSNGGGAVFGAFAMFVRDRDITHVGTALDITVRMAAIDLDISPAAVLMKAGEIMGVGLRKHGPCTWRIAGTEQADPQTHYASAVRHILEHLDGVTVDPDSGKHPLLHAVCQIAIMINLLDDPPDYPDDNDGRAMIGRPR